MTRRFIRLCLVSTLILLCAFRPSWASVEGPGGGDQAVLGRVVPSFSITRLSLVDALLQLGQQAQVPLGIEYVDRDSVEKPLSLNLGRSTVQQVLAALFRVEQGYIFRVRAGVIDMSHAGAPTGKRSLLDYRLPGFSVPHCPIGEASHALYLDLFLALHPDARGIAGDYSPGDPKDVVGPLKLRDATVREVLNRLVSASRKSAWIVQVPTDHLVELPSSGLWTIVEYESPPRRYAHLLYEIIWGAAEATGSSEHR